MKCITYKKGYKYQLAEKYETTIDITPDKNVKTDYIELTLEGELTIKKSYAWDGPSGPTFDTKNFMRGSLVHDALYQLMRNKHLNFKRDRDPADRLLQKMCKADGMTKARAWWVYKGLALAGKAAARPENKKDEIIAPKGCKED